VGRGPSPKCGRGHSGECFLADEAENLQGRRYPKAKDPTRLTRNGLPVPLVLFCLLLTGRKSLPEGKEPTRLTGERASDCLTAVVVQAGGRASRPRGGRGGGGGGCRRTEEPSKFCRTGARGGPRPSPHRDEARCTAPKRGEDPTAISRRKKGWSFGAVRPEGLKVVLALTAGASEKIFRGKVAHCLVGSQASVACREQGTWFWGDRIFPGPVLAEGAKNT